MSDSLFIIIFSYYYHNIYVFMKSILLIILIGFTFFLNSQINLDQNNVSATITDLGFFFNNPFTDNHGYEVPIGSGSHTIYSSVIWFGGLDINGQIMLAAQDLYGINDDLWSGPLTVDSAVAVTPNPLLQSIWSITKSEIDSHIVNYNQPAYIVPASIMNWPAHGDISLGLSYYLAPFVDVNNDGYYNPLDGDYPCIKGDRAIYKIMNDKYDIHGSGGLPLGIEVHFMFYQFNSNNYLDNTTFIDVDIFNRSSEPIYDFKTSFVCDSDIGNPFDDYFGCDSSRNNMYCYNGDDFDENYSGILGYGNNPPSSGIVSLSHDLESVIGFGNFPTGVFEIWNIMNGFLPDGSIIYNNFGQPTSFYYSGNPNNLGSWSEMTALNSPGDRRIIMTITEDTLEYQGHEKYTFAVLYDRSGTTAIENVNGLLAISDSVQSFFNSNLIDVCPFLTMELDDMNMNKFLIYPNPCNGSFNLNIEFNKEYNLIISDLSGRVVYKSLNLTQEEIVVNPKIPPGIYIVNIHTKGVVYKKRLVVE